MALFPCPECKREISTDAKVCPHCGKSPGMAATAAKWRALPKAARILLIGAGCFFAVAMCINSAADKQADKAPAPAAQAAKASALALAKDGKMTVQPGTWFGYRTRELLERATKIAVQGDKAAWARLMSEAAAADALVPLKAGEEVFVEDTALMAGAVKIRRKGETASWWTSYEAVKPN